MPCLFGLLIALSCHYQNANRLEGNDTTAPLIGANSSGGHISSESGHLSPISKKVKTHNSTIAKPVKAAKKKQFGFSASVEVPTAHSDRDETRNAAPKTRRRAQVTDSKLDAKPLPQTERITSKRQARDNVSSVANPQAPDHKDFQAIEKPRTEYIHHKGQVRRIVHSDVNGKKVADLQTPFVLEAPEGKRQEYSHHDGQKRRIVYSDVNGQRVADLETPFVLEAPEEQPDEYSHHDGQKRRILYSDVNGQRVAHLEAPFVLEAPKEKRDEYSHHDGQKRRIVYSDVNGQSVADLETPFVLEAPEEQRDEYSHHDDQKRRIVYSDVNGQRVADLETPFVLEAPEEQQTANSGQQIDEFAHAVAPSTRDERKNAAPKKRRRVQLTDSKLEAKERPPTERRASNRHASDKVANFTKPQASNAKDFQASEKPRTEYIHHTGQVRRILYSGVNGKKVADLQTPFVLETPKGQRDEYTHHDGQKRRIVYSDANGQKVADLETPFVLEAPGSAAG